MKKLKMIVAVMGVSLAALGYVQTQPLGNLGRTSQVVTGVSGFATEQDLANQTNNLNQTATAVGTIWSFVFGSSAWFSITNYMSSTEGVAPKLSFYEVRDGKTNMVYSVKGEVAELMSGPLTNILNSVTKRFNELNNTKADRAWSKYQSVTGEEAPDGVTVVSTPTIMLSGNFEWKRYVDVSSNSVWFLQNNGVTTLGGTTNSYFTITDDDGKAQFTVRKRGSQILSAQPSEVGFNDDGDFFVKYPINTQPTMSFSYSLDGGGDWFDETERTSEITVDWTYAGGVYTGVIHQTPKHESLFVKAVFIQEGFTVIENGATSSFEGGIMIDNVKYHPTVKTINGEKVLGLRTE